MIKFEDRVIQVINNLSDQMAIRDYPHIFIATTQKSSRVNTFLEILYTSKIYGGEKVDLFRLYCKLTELVSKELNMSTDELVQKIYEKYCLPF